MHRSDRVRRAYADQADRRASRRVKTVNELDLLPRPSSSSSVSTAAVPAPTPTPPRKSLSMHRQRNDLDTQLQSIIDAKFQVLEQIDEAERAATLQDQLRRASDQIARYNALTDDDRRALTRVEIDAYMSAVHVLASLSRKVYLDLFAYAGVEEIVAEPAWVDGRISSMTVNRPVSTGSTDAGLVRLSLGSASTSSGASSSSGAESFHTAVSLQTFYSLVSIDSGPSYSSLPSMASADSTPSYVNERSFLRDQDMSEVFLALASGRSSSSSSSSLP